MKPFADWAYIRFHRLQLDYLMRGEMREETRNEQAVVLFDESCQEITQCNDRALSSGIYKGMALADAWLLEDNLQAIPADFVFEGSLLEQQAQALYMHMADIALDPETCGLWIRLDRLHRLFEDQHAIQTCIHTVMDGLSFSLALSDNPRAAQFYTHPAAPSLQASSLSTELVLALARVGLTSADQVLAMPVAVIGQKFGGELVDWLLQMKGQNSLPLAFFQPHPGFRQMAQLTTEVVTWQGLRFTLHRLLQLLERYLGEFQQATTRVELHIDSRTGYRTTVPLQLAAPAHRAEHFLELFQIILEKRSLSTPALYLELTTDTLEPLVTTSGTLDKKADTTQSNLPALLRRLEMRLKRGSPERLYTLFTTSHWMPDKQQLKAVAGGNLSGTCHQQLDKEWRPVWLTDAQPVQIECWRIASQKQIFITPWWLGESVKYEYVKAQHTASGQWAWLRYSSALQWQLVGWAC